MVIECPNCGEEFDDRFGWKINPSGRHEVTLCMKCARKGETACKERTNIDRQRQMKRKEQNKVMRQR